MSSISTAFFYAKNDKQFANKLDEHLSGLRRQGLITIVHNPAALSDYRLIVLFLSSGFLSDSSLVEIMTRAYQHRSGRVIIPIILRDVDLSPYSFKDFICLPRNGKPVTRHQNKDRVWTEISKDIHKRVVDLS